jgi:hypothetical protein
MGRPNGGSAHAKNDEEVAMGLPHAVGGHNYERSVWLNVLIVAGGDKVREVDGA